MNFKDVETSLSKIVEFKHIDSIDDVYNSIQFCMEFVENFKDLKSKQKKDIVINCITFIIKNNIEDGVKQELLLDILDPTVEMIIQISKNKWFLNKIKTKFSCCM